MKLVFDLEANGLYEEVDTLWCCTSKDVDTGETQSVVGDHNIHDADEIIGHHIIGYDLPVLKKIKGWEPKPEVKIKDTLVMSRLANPDRQKPAGYKGEGGPNSLECWGYRIGRWKPEHKDWSKFSPEMLHRNKEDVEINTAILPLIEEELSDFSQESIDLEHEVARIITEQEHYGIRYDIEKSKEYIKYLEGLVKEVDDELLPELPKDLEIIGTTVRDPFLKTGGYIKRVREYIENAYLSHDTAGQYGQQFIGGPFTRIAFHAFPINSVKRVKEYLLDNGWQPEFWNYSKTTGERTSPKLEGEFIGIDGELPRLVKQRISLEKRISILKGWQSVGHWTNDGYFVIPAGANTCGAVTGRFTHYNVVNIPRATADKKTGELVWDLDKQHSLFGTQMRSLFIPRDDYVIVGHDASGIELRMLAHYMQDEEFTYQVLHGDIHTYNQQKAGLPTRDAAKTFIYALLYGAGDAKIGSIIGGTAEDGKRIKETYFRELPRLDKLIKKVKRASGKGWLRGLDGRRIYMRRDESGKVMRRKALNTLLQGAAAVVMKRSCVILWDEVKRSQIDAHKVLDMHDEGQSEVANDPETIELYCKLAVDSIVRAGEHYNLNIPLAADVKVGMNMAETH